MRYLFGDSSDSPFKANVLEFVRDAIDFSVYVLEADARIRVLCERIEALQRKAAEDIDELERFESGLLDAIAAVPKRSGSPLVLCSEQMTSSCRQVARASISAVRARVAADIAQLEAEESAERDGCVKALAALVGPHEPPDSSAVLHLQLRDGGGYDGVWAGDSKALGLSWKLALGFPDGHSFGQTVRVERFAPGLVIHAPELTGWIRKEIKNRPQQIARYVINDVATEGSTIGIRVCVEPKSDAGFDIDCKLDAGHVSATRLGSGNGQTAGEFEVVESDVPKLVDMSKSIHASLGQLTRLHLTKALVGDVEFRGLSSYVPFVERVIDQLAPIIREIALHSFDPNELVLRSQLADNRREEIFVSRKTLRDKYAHLPAAHAQLFAPLALDSSLSRSVMPPALASVAERDPRSELPRSQRPPPPLQPAATVAIPAAPAELHLEELALEDDDA